MLEEKRSAELSGVDFRALLDAVPGLCLVLLPNDPIYTVVTANKAYAQATLTDQDEIIGRSLFEVFPDRAPGLHASLRQAIATKSAHTMAVQRYDIRRPQDRGGGFEECYWSPVNTPLLGQDGDIQFIIHRAEDVTELVRLRRLEAGRGELVEEKLRAREALFSLAFAQAPIGMVLLTPEGLIVEANQAFADMLGYTAEELVLRDSSSYTHADDNELTRNYFKSLQAGPHKTGSIEKRYFRKDGGLVWARASATMRRDALGKPAQVIAIVEDITERKRAEARYRFLAESIPQMVWTATPDGMLDYVNKQGSEYFGVPQEALLGAGWLAWVHPEEQESAVERWKRSLDTGEPYETSFRLKRGSDASWRWHLVRALPLFGDNGNLVEWFGTCTDIEDQRQADSKLHQQWSAFDTALSNTPDFIYTFDLEGRFTYVNRALLALWQKTLEQALGKNFFELDYPPELAARLQLQIQQVIDTKHLVRDQTPYTGAAGETGYYEYIFVPVLDAKGRVRAVAGSTRDITEQTLVAQQIEDDRRRWRELFSQTPAAIAVLRGPEHTFQWVNSDYVRLVARSAEFLVGKSVQEAFPDLEGQIYVDLLNSVYQTGKPYTGRETLLRLDRGDGVLQDLYINFVNAATRDPAGEIDGIFVHVIDVTDMVEARKRVEESERQFRTLAETIPHLAWMADETGNRLWYNRRWYDYTGTTFDEVKNWGWLMVHEPAVRPAVRERWRVALGSGEPFEMVDPLKATDGSSRSFLTRVEPVKDMEGRVVRWFGTNTDITDQRKIEQELRRMNRELEEFAYVASHDLQEPLRMVNIYTQLILKNPENEREQLALYAGYVREGVTRMETLIHDLLTFSRSVQIDDSPIGAADLSISFADALSVLKGRIEEVGAVIQASTLPVVSGDASQFTHVFQNVLSNALKYRNKDVRPEILVSAKQDGDLWIISVEDNGIGFDPKYAERIFGLFKRLHKDEYEGTGLGLAICKRIVERYGGRIWAEGRVGAGATIYFSLPRLLSHEYN